MKEIMTKASSSKNQGVASFEYCPRTRLQPSLLSLEKPLDQLKIDLLDLLTSQTLSVIEIYEQHNVGTRYIKPNYKEALLQLEEKGLICCNPSADKRPIRNGKRTLADKTLIVISPKE